MTKHIGTVACVLIAMLQLPRVDTFWTGLAFATIIYEVAEYWKKRQADKLIAAPRS